MKLISATMKNNTTRHEYSSAYFFTCFWNDGPQMSEKMGLTDYPSTGVAV